MKDRTKQSSSSWYQSSRLITVQVDLSVEFLACIYRKVSARLFLQVKAAIRRICQIDFSRPRFPIVRRCSILRRSVCTGLSC
jgi:hypothetical protein